jgi:hypothetical protein
MSPLNNQHKHLIFDYCIGLTSEEQTAEAQILISSNDEAAEIHSNLKAALAPLASLQPETCPDELAERTILRLNNAERSSRLRLQQLLAGEQDRDVVLKGTFLHKLGKIAGKIAVAAAVFLVMLAAFQSSSNFARQQYGQYRCRAQLGNIFRGLDNYIDDNDGKLPALATTQGAPWWKVGYQGQENHSNTRCMWLLVKGGYVEPTNFVCPGRKQKLVIRFESSQVKFYNDFPGRQHITYSIRICCENPTVDSLSKKVLMADLSPLFEDLPQDLSQPFNKEVDEDLLNHNSINHNYRGQNILMGDGSSRFQRSRLLGITRDDMFTLQNIHSYNGTERPTSEADNFLAP